MDKFLTVKEFAQMVHMSASRIYALVAQGAIPCYRIGGTIRLRVEDFKDEVEFEG